VPYSSNAELPAAVRSKYSDKCQRAFRHAWSSSYAEHGDESRAFATAHSAAQKCQGGTKSVTDELTINKQIDFKIFSSQLTPHVLNDGKLRLRTIASSSVEDLGGDIVTANALKNMADSAKGMTVFRNHSYKVPGDILGSVENAFVQQAKSFDDYGMPIHELVLDVVVFGDNPENVRTHKAAEDGVMLGTSIGAMIPKGAAKKNANGGITFDDLRLKEASIVGIPQNPRSWVQYATKALKVAESEPDDDKPNREFITAGDDSVTFTVSAPQVTTTTSSTDVSNAKVWVTHDQKGSSVTVDTDGPDEAAKLEDQVDGKSKKKDAEPEVEKTIEPRILADGEKLEEGDLSIAEGISLAEEPKDIGESSKETAPELVKESAVVAATSEDETPPAQELEQSVPESAAAAASSGEDSLSSDTLSRSASLLADVVQALNSENDTLRKSLRDTTEERDAAKTELLETKANLKLAKEIVEKIAKTPLGRKGVVAAQVSEFESLEARYGGIYSSGVLKSLEKKT
jgi:cation transport regulator ChaB